MFIIKYAVLIKGFIYTISPQVEAVTEEGKKPYKSNKQVKTDVTFESFLDLMHGDLKG